MDIPMTDRERLEKIDKRYHYLCCFEMSHQDREWLMGTLKEYMDEQETVRKQYKLFCKTIREYDKLMLERRRELDIYNTEHPPKE